MSYCNKTLPKLTNCVLTTEIFGPQLVDRWPLRCRDVRPDHWDAVFKRTVLVWWNDRPLCLALAGGGPRWRSRRHPGDRHGRKRRELLSRTEERLCRDEEPGGPLQRPALCGQERTRWAKPPRLSHIYLLFTFLSANKTRLVLQIGPITSKIIIHK